jgi:hypothetical protein
MIRERIDRVFERLADTTFASGVLQLANDTAYGFARIIRGLAWARLIFDKTLQRPIASVVQWIKILFSKNLRLGIAQEMVLPDEDRVTREIIEVFRQNLARRYITRQAERGANAKTYGIVRAEFRVLPGLPENLAKGVFREPRSYPAWIRVADTGSVITADPEHVGVVGMGIKLMQVPGAKLLEDEKNTQDFTLIGVRTFTASNTAGMAKLQTEILKYRPAFYFFNPLYPGRFLDFIMQALDSRQLGSPLESQLYSCTAHLHGEGQAVHYSVRPCSKDRTPVPNFPSDNYLRQAMIDKLRDQDVSFDFMVQLQKNPRRQPIEDASIEWREPQTPFIPVAKIHIPRQKFDSLPQLKFADILTITPWHCLPEHLPLGNINRSRRDLYREMAKLRQSMNGVQHYEPTGDEQFE